MYRIAGISKYARFLFPALVGIGSTLAQATSADEVVVGHFNVVPVESLKAAEPHKIALSDKKPASITAEPIYRGKPLYGQLKLGSSKKSTIVMVLDTFPGDKLPKLYVDVNGTGDLSGKPAYFPLHPLTAFATDDRSAVSAVNANPGGSGVPIGVMAPTVARYDIKGATQTVQCPLLFTLFGDELDYTVSVQHVGTLSVSGTSFKVALVDLAANAVFDNYNHSDDKPPVVDLMIDRNGDGKFDRKREAFDLAKPFRLGGTAYELASIDAEGTVIALQPTTKRPEGTISPDDLAIGSDSIDFIAKSTDGKTINFPSQYRHHVVLLVFWSTTNAASIAECSNLVGVYNEFNKYGFDILGVSLDKANKKDVVTAFCEQAGMVWPEIYDGKVWDSEVARLYGVDTIPRAFLIDGDTGTVLGLAEGVRGQALQSSVTKALTKKGLLPRQR